MLFMNIIFAIAFIKSSIVKKYLIIFSKLIIDGFMAFSEQLNGIGKIIVLLNGAMERRSRRECLFMPWNLIYLWSEPLSAIILMIISIDRLIALSFPLQYHKYGCQLQAGQIILWVILVAPLIVFAFYRSFFDNGVLHTPLC
ncbi:unnamed protein product [Dracunculus medinensis]|uniref:G_PROTEIN_RECEP_F1_2 domain-containing protein n=1 Tax=Dracunculus medinensis TaxID=318479 RepID=A0A0N4UAA3_DRAME|nr:unnamed protein product [Dracunculus medinensis]